MSNTTQNQDAARVERLLQTTLDALGDMKALDVRVIDVRGQTSITDIMVIASGTSTRHVKAVADRVEEAAKAIGVRPLGVEGQKSAEWILIDLVDVVVHVMLPEVRDFYALEKLWSVGGDADKRAPRD